MDQFQNDILIVGAGLSGLVCAERLAKKGFKVLVIEKRNHIGGNCYDEIDSETNILYNLYGAHIFHTNSEIVWDYIQQFGEWIPYHHKVYGFDDIKNAYYPIPSNLETLNLFLNQNFKSEQDLLKWKQIHKDEFLDSSIIPTNSMQVALLNFGKTVYENVIRPYTIKQWDKDPSELDPSVLKRLPLKTNFDQGYFNDKFQALPKNGYTKWFENLIQCANKSKDQIEIKLNTNFFDFYKYNKYKFKHIIFTGQIDEWVQYFNSDLNIPKLEYRSLKFEKEIINLDSKEQNQQNDYYQKSFVINYPSLKYPFTRIVEYKHYTNHVFEKSNPNLKSNSNSKTLIVKEYPLPTGEPYYPVPSEENINNYTSLKSMIPEYLEDSKLWFVGRLASYKYFNMDQAIEAALNLIEKNF